MRYSDFVTSPIDYSRSNKLAQTINLQEYLDDIHEMPQAEFSEFYIPRPATQAPTIEEELISYLTSMTISTLRGFQNREPDNSDLVSLSQRLKESRQFRRQTVTVVAPKGNGKTTFLHHFFRIDLPKIGMLYPSRRFIAPIFDFREEITAGTVRLEAVVKNEIREFMDNYFIEELWPGSLKDQRLYYENVYKFEIDLFIDVLLKAAISNEICKFGSPDYKAQVECINRFKQEHPFDFLARKIERYKARFPELWIIISVDNVDHHLPENPSEIIAIFQQLKDKLDVDLIYTLRDTSFLQLNSMVRHDAWGGIRILTLGPISMSEIGTPRIKVTLDRARDLLSTEEQELLAEIASKTIVNALGQRRTVKFNFDIIWSWIQKMTNYNYRYALDVLNRSLRSFHLFDHNFERERHNPARRFDVVKGGIHVKKMKTALINGLALFYSSDKSATPIVNLFDAGDLKLKGNHILRVKMIQYIALKEVFELGDISKKFIDVFGDQYAVAIKRSLFEMVLKGLIVIVNKSGVPVFADDFGGYGGIERYDDIQIMTGQIGASGRFHVDELLDDDIYLDEMKYATDFDTERYEKIFANVPEKHPVLRKHSTRRFIKEVVKVEDRFANHSATLGVSRSRIAQSLKAYESQKAWEAFFHQKTGG